MFNGHDRGIESAPLQGQSLWGRQVREKRTPVNVGNQPHRDNGEGLAFGLPLTHWQKIAQGKRGAGAPRAALGRRSNDFSSPPESPALGRFGGRGWERGAVRCQLTSLESRVSLFSKCLSARSVIFAIGHDLPPHPDPLPQRPPGSGCLWGRGRNPRGTWTQGGVRSSYSALCPGLMSVALSGRSMEDAAPAASLFLEKCPISRVQARMPVPTFGSAFRCRTYETEY